MNLNPLRDLELAGVKWELAETTHSADRKQCLRPVHKAAKNPADFTSGTATANTVVPPATPVALSVAQNAAEKIMDLEVLLDTIRGFDHPLRQFVKNVVLPHFAKTPQGLLVITDAPGPDDDNTGHILTGVTGDLMDKMLSAINMDRTNVSILPLVFWRTPGGRTPAREELDLAKPFVTRAIELLQPKVILTLGTLTAAEFVPAKLPKNHGETFDGPFGVPLIPIYHPNYLILKPEAKRDVWAALQKLQNLLKNCEE